MRGLEGMPGEPELISAQTDEQVDVYADWRGRTLAKVRSLIKAADPGMVEDRKWRGTPVWCHDGIVCTGETYRNVVKLTFAHGAAISDPDGLFNASLDGRIRRALDLHEHDNLDEAAFQRLIRAAVVFNATRLRSPRKQRAGRRQTSTSASSPLS